MNVGVITLDFDDLGFLHDGHNFGCFSGRAEIDQDGNVVHLCIDTIDRAQAFWDADVPKEYDGNNLICNLADNIAGSLKHEIKDKLDDWHVSLAEKEWETREAAE